jgi:hypothetical protein
MKSRWLGDMTPRAFDASVIDEVCLCQRCASGLSRIPGRGEINYFLIFRTSLDGWIDSRILQSGPALTGGAFRDRHGRWSGMRWTRLAPLTNGAGADGEVVWSWTPSAGVDGGYQAWYAGESTKEAVTPLRGECRVISGVTVVTTLVCFVSFLHARLRAHQAPGIPCAL